MVKDATLSRRGKLFPRSYIRGNILDSSPKTNRISITVTRVRFEPGFPGRVRSGITTRLTEFLLREVDPKGWSTVLIAAQGSWEKVVHCSQPIYDIIGSDVVQEGAV